MPPSYKVTSGHPYYGHSLMVRPFDDWDIGFPDIGIDHSWILRRNLFDDAAMMNMRRLLIRSSRSVASVDQLSDEQVIRLLLEQIESRKLTIVRPATGEGESDRLSGAKWWHAHEASYPNSSKLSDLDSSFRSKVEKFIDALEDAGAQVKVSATRRNAKRAFLMHYSWAVANGQVAPNAVPAEPGVDIIWDHKNLKKSRAAAQEMVDLFHMAFIASLTSLHIKGLAIDMDISWSGTIKIEDAKGETIELGTPRTGARNDKLHDVGATYGVIKLLSDPPHWSSTGH